MLFGKLNKLLITIILAIGTISIANASSTNLQHRVKKKLQPYATYIGIETSKTSNAYVSYAQSLKNTKQCSTAEMSLADFYAFTSVPAYAYGYLKEIKSSQRPQDSLDKIALAFRIDSPHSNSPNKVQIVESVQNKINIDGNSQAATSKDLYCSRVDEGIFAQALSAKSQMNYIENVYSTAATTQSKEESIYSKSINIESKNAIEIVKSKDSSIETIRKLPHIRDIDASTLNRKGILLVVLEDSKDILSKFRSVTPINTLDGEVQSKKSNYSIEPYRTKDIKQAANSAEVKKLSKWDSLLIGYEGDWLSLPWQYYFRSQHLLLRGQNDDREFAALQKYIERQFDRYESLETNKYCIAWSISSKNSRLDGRSQASYGMKNTLDSIEKLLVDDVSSRIDFKFKANDIKEITKSLKKSIEIGKKIKTKLYMPNKMLLMIEIVQM